MEYRDAGSQVPIFETGASNKGTYVLGVDAGAVSLSAVEVDRDGQIVRTFYELHHGQARTCLERILGEVDLGRILGIAATTSTPAFIRADARFDNQICLITAARRRHPDCRSILVVGGERFGLVRFAADGTYLSFKANPLCAAGTGGFLDQQARRLSLKGASELAGLARENHDTPPPIASRCAVFAKTDLAHAQQEGHSLEAISDGLCRGVATNIVDTLFTGETIHGPLLMVGGVARNAAVVRHLRKLLGLEMVVDEQLAHGAFGAALKLLDEFRFKGAGDFLPVVDIIDRKPRKKDCELPPLELRLSEYPAFDSLERSIRTGRIVSHSHPLEIDLYRELAPQSRHDAYLGIDIGSTSTKAVLTDLEGGVIAGFYTATAGKPLVAAQLILEAVADLEKQKAIELNIVGAGTTGAGRKFVGKILGADLVLDEITAHARAAVELHPEVDTIIEIGGQDSKFTILRDGRVTLSVMNNVCAAGTGSFIEEQARRLEVPLSEYGERTQGCGSPIASERCTVFMERDLNHYLNEGYSRGEVLAAVLHSVRENYLNKVAVESAIGKTIVFQGATARNRALIAAFEQRIGKPILVSPFCHLTGALGVALTLRDEGVLHSTFRGLDVHRQSIPIWPEICDVCSNHCRLSIAEVSGETVAFGFLCGRDYGVRKRVANNTSGFDLFRERARALATTGQKWPKTGPIIGIPAALHLFDDLRFWKVFFHRLGIRTATSERYAEAVKEGRRLAGAELCAPLTALHAHVAHLRERCDAVFLPFYLEKKSSEKGARRQLCYYTQFAPSFAGGEAGGDLDRPLIRPIVHSLYGPVFTKAELYHALRPIVPAGLSPFDVSAAFDEAVREKNAGLARLREVYQRETAKREDFHVVLLGRPYTVLSEWMNKGIPDRFASLGVPVFYQDMLSYRSEDISGIASLLKEVHWHYAATILEAAEVTARTPSAYPVLLTSFKCSPDSFVTDYFRQIVESHGKPYLVLQLDEHDSRLGYETRVEAAVRAFSNHHQSERRKAAPSGSSRLPSVLWPSRGKVDLSGKTLLFPNWDSLSQRLVVASVRRTGRDARLLEPSEGSMRRSLRHNSGQCTPLNIIAQDFVEYVWRHDLDPSRAVLWIGASDIACNVRLYPYHIRAFLQSQGRGFERAEVYSGAMTLLDISASLPYDVYLAYMFGGFIRRMGCKIRPAETHTGETDALIEEGIRTMETVFESGGPKEEALEHLVERFQAIETRQTGDRPKVAIFGDLYSRDNPVLNQDLIHFIEAHGGEVVTTPYTSYAKMIVRPYYWKWILEGNYKNALATSVLMAGFKRVEKKYFRQFRRILRESDPVYDSSPRAILSEYNVSVVHTGEAMDNLLKVFYLVKHHPDVALFVQASPAFCCPSLVTEAMSHMIETKTGVPVVSVTYDGTGGTKNEVILPYLEYPRRTRAAQAVPVEVTA